MSFQFLRACAALAFSCMSAASARAREAADVMIWDWKSEGSSLMRTVPFLKNAPSWNLSDMLMTLPGTSALSVVEVFVLTVP